MSSLTRLFKSKRAISPILATLLLVVIAVGAIVVTYAWVMMYMGHLTGQAGVVLKEVDVSFHGNGTLIYFDVQNTGTSDTTVIQVYVGTSFSSMDNQTITPLPLLAGQWQRITVSYSWQPGAVYSYKVLTSSGQSLSGNRQAPPNLS